MKYLIERRDRLTQLEWQQRLRLDHSTWTSLVERGVFTLVNSEQFVLSFVGFAALPNEFIVAAPKYKSHGNDAKAAEYLQATLAHYFERVDSRREVSADDQQVLLHRDPDVFTEYELWLTLRSWYRTHGLYVRCIRGRDDNWGRVVDWPRTIGRTSAIYSEEGIVYPAPIMIRPTAAISEVTNIQLSILAALEDKYLLDNEAPIAAEHRAAHAVLRDRIEANRAAMALVVSRERNQAYRSDDIALLTAMHSWLHEERSGRDGYSVVRLFGTTRFEYVWEDACRLVFGNGPPRPMPAPYWTIAARPAQKKEPSRPDIWCTLADKRSAVLDAKYYHPLPESVPGWADVVKQLFYPLAVESKVKVVNGFLFPDPNVAAVTRVGHVDIRNSAGVVISQFGHIHVFAVNPDALFARYQANILDTAWLGTIANLT